MSDVFNNIEENFVMFRDMVKEVPDQYNNNIKEIDRLQKEQEDLLHVLEFLPLDSFKMHKISKQLVSIRQERRRLKNQNELLEPFIPLMKKYRNDLRNMDSMLGEVRKRERVQEIRGYRCRVRKDLQESFDKNKAIGI